MDTSVFIDEFVAASFAPGRWPAVLDDIACAADAEGATLIFGRSTPHSVAVSQSITAVVRDYFETRTVDDPREDRVVAGPGDGFLTDFDFFTQEEIDRDPFYQDFLRPNGFAWHGVALLSWRHVPTLLSLKRTIRQGPYEERELRSLDRVVPYLRGAATAAAAAHAGLLQHRLDAYASDGLHVIALDRRGRPIENGAAVPLVDGIEVRDGRLRASHAGDQAALEAAIALALAPERPSRKPPPRRVPLRRRSGRWPLMVEIVPLLDRPHLSALEPAALLLVDDLDQDWSPELRALRDLFQLTRREAELAAGIACGDSLAATAEQMRISRAHARQRLKAVFRKTGTHRQAELVSLLARLGERRGTSAGA